MPSSGVPGVMICRYAPMSAFRSTLSPRIVPSDVAAISMSWIWSRPWWVDTMCSLRPSVHLTGRPSFLARTTERTSSRLICSLAPKPPPTSGATTRMLFSEMPVSRASSTRRTWGICVEVQMVISSLIPIGAATTERGSIGLGMSRWLMNRRLTTTSALALAAA